MCICLRPRGTPGGATPWCTACMALPSFGGGYRGASDTSTRRERARGTVHRSKAQGEEWHNQGLVKERAGVEKRELSATITTAPSFPSCPPPPPHFNPRGSMRKTEQRGDTEAGTEGDDHKETNTLPSHTRPRAVIPSLSGRLPYLVQSCPILMSPHPPPPPAPTPTHDHTHSPTHTPPPHTHSAPNPPILAPPSSTMADEAVWDFLPPHLQVLGQWDHVANPLPPGQNHPDREPLIRAARFLVVDRYGNDVEISVEDVLGVNPNTSGEYPWCISCGRQGTSYAMQSCFNNFFVRDSAPTPSTMHSSMPSSSPTHPLTHPPTHTSMPSFPPTYRRLSLRTMRAPAISLGSIV